MKYLAEYLLLLLIAIVTIVTIAIFTVSGFDFGAYVVFAMGVVILLQFLKEAIIEYVEGA